MTDLLRIVHCSDIHLDGDHYDDGAYVGASDYYREAFLRALAAMRGHEPHLMLLAGDLFDTNDATPETIEWAMQCLAEQPFPIAMIPGNHDCLTDGSIYRHYDFNAIDNVAFLDSAEGDTVWFEELGVAVWGKGMVDHSPEFSPLGGSPTRPDGCRWYLGMGHGIHVPHGEPSHRSSPVHMREIEESPFDYIGLGHHHAALILSTPDTGAAYCGSPTDTVGGAATYAVADLMEGGATRVDIRAVESD